MDGVQKDPSRPRRRTMSIQERIKAMNLTLEEEENRLSGGGGGDNFSLPTKMRLSPTPSKHLDSLTSEETAELTDDEVAPKRASVVEMWRRREASKSKVSPQASMASKESSSPATTPNLSGKLTSRSAASSSPVPNVPSHQVVLGISSSEEDKRTGIYAFEEKKEQNLEDEAEWKNFEDDEGASHPIISSGPVDLTLLRPYSFNKSDSNEDPRPTSLSVSNKSDGNGSSFEEATPSRIRTNVVDIWKKRGTPTSSGAGGYTLTTSVAPTHNEESDGGKTTSALESLTTGRNSTGKNSPRRSIHGQDSTDESEGNRTDRDGGDEAVNSIMAKDARSAGESRKDEESSVQDTPSSRNLRSKVRSRWRQRAPTEQAHSIEDPSFGITQPSSGNTLDKSRSSFIGNPSPKGRTVEPWNGRGLGAETNGPQLTSARSMEESGSIKAATVKNQGSPSPFNNVRASWERRGSEKHLMEAENSSASNGAGHATNTSRNSVAQRWSPSLKGEASPIVGTRPDNSTQISEANTSQSSHGNPRRSPQPRTVKSWPKRTDAFASGSLERDEAARPVGVAGRDSLGSDNASRQPTQPAYPSDIVPSKSKSSIKMVPKLAVNVSRANPGTGDTVAMQGEDCGAQKPSLRMSYGFQRRNKHNLKGQAQNGVDEPGQNEMKTNTNPASFGFARKIVDKKQYLLARHRQRVKAARTPESSATDEGSEDSSALEQAFLDTVPSDEQNKLSQDLLGKKKMARASGIVVAPSVPVDKLMACGQAEHVPAGHGAIEDQAGPLSAITQSEYASLCVSDSDSFVLSGLSQSNPCSPKTAEGGDANSAAGQSDARSFVSGAGSAFTGVSASLNTSKQAASPLAARASRVLRDKRLRRKDDRTSVEDQNGDAHGRLGETTKLRHRTNPPERSPKIQQQSRDSALLNPNVVDPTVSAATGQTSTSPQSPTAFGATSSMQSPSAFGPTTRRNFSFGSDTTGASSQMLSTSASETDTRASSHRTDLSSIMKPSGYQGKSLQALEPAKEMVAEEFVSESNSNVQAFQNAYQALSLEQIANDLKEEVAGSMLNVQNLDFQNIDFAKLASDLNEGMSAASESLNKLVGGVSDNDGRKSKLRVPDRGGSPIEEGVAIEVEYIEDSDEEDGPQNL